MNGATKNSPLKVVFMGTPDFSATALNAVTDAGHEVVAVYCQPPRPAGRGKKLRKSAVQELAEQKGIAVFTPPSFKDPEDVARFVDLKADVAVVVAYGLILPQAMLDAPGLGCFNIHASLLPRWRGAAPIQRAIMQGDTETGVNIMQMEAGLDTGPVVLSSTVAIKSDSNAETLHDELAELGARLVVQALEGARAGTLNPTVQDPNDATYAAKIDKAETRINWAGSAEQVSAQVRGLYPVAWFDLEGDRVRVRSLEVLEQPIDASPGQVMAAQEVLDVACGTGAVRIKRVQRQGKSEMDADAFLRGCPLEVGRVLG